MRKLDIAAAILGIGVFAGVVWKVGPAALAAKIEHVWMGFALLLLFSLSRLLLQTWSWSTSLSANEISHSFAELIGMRMGCQSLGYLSTFGPILSEPLKIRLLGSSCKSATATLVDTSLYWFTSILLGIIGSVASGILLMHTIHVVWIYLSVSVLFGSLLLLARKTPLLTAVIALLGSRSTGWLRKGAFIEGEIRRFRFGHPQAVHRMFWVDLVCQSLMTGEVAVMLWALGAHLTLFTILAIEACTRAVKLAGGWLPARIGADEAGTIGAFVIFGLSPASGLTLALARRSRDLLWCLCGLLWLAWNARRSKTEIVREAKGELSCSL